ncbi:hypothetical protein MIR68_000786 [Amoeboaphelidium protococcarum]|nr:hypothetical protein MIR68_000786 [Amoeboaphelidium protococcarum]
MYSEISSTSGTTCDNDSDGNDMVLPELDIGLEDLSIDTQYHHQHQQQYKSPCFSPVSTDAADHLYQSESLHRWIIGIAVLNFDLEIGQVIEQLYPSGTQLDKVATSNIQYASFPDTSSALGDSVFSFRVRQEDGTFIHGYVMFRRERNSQIRRGYMQKSITVLSHLPYPGLFLRVVSILGPLYFDQLSPQNDYQVQGNLNLSSNNHNIIEQACLQIALWPQPRFNDILELPFFNVRMQVELTPVDSSTQLLETSSFVKMQKIQSPQYMKSNLNGSNGLNVPSITEQIIGGIPSTLIYPSGFLFHSESDNLITHRDVQSRYPSGSSFGLYTLFKNNMSDLYTLWELVLLEQPICVMSECGQSIVSETVWYLQSLISPIVYKGEYHPYLTIQDSDFASLNRMFSKDNMQMKSKASADSQVQPSDVAQSGVILGVTNPFFRKAFSTWPHILHLVYNKQQDIDSSLRVNEPGVVKSKSYGNIKSAQQQQQKFSSDSLSKLVRSASPTALFRPGSPAGIRTSQSQSKARKPQVSELKSLYKPALRPDKKFVFAMQNLKIDNMQAQAQVSSSGHQNGHSHKTDSSSNSNRKKYKGYVLNETVRRHFVDLTERFLGPLNRYILTQLTPKIRQFNIDGELIDGSHQQQLQVNGKVLVYSVLIKEKDFKLQNFDNDAFITHLVTNEPPQLQFAKTSFLQSGSLKSLTKLSQQQPPQSSSQSSSPLSKPFEFRHPPWVCLYIKFIQTKNFECWLNQKRLTIEQELLTRNAEKLISILDQDVSGKHPSTVFSLLVAAKSLLAMMKYDLTPDLLRHGEFLEEQPLQHSDDSLHQGHRSDYLIVELKKRALYIWNNLLNDDAYRDLIITGQL